MEKRALHERMTTGSNLLHLKPSFSLLACCVGEKKTRNKCREMTPSSSTSTLNLSHSHIPGIDQTGSRRRVKEAYMLERCSDGKLKPRYLVLYSDAVVCYRCKKQRTSNEFIMAVKWYSFLSLVSARTEPPKSKTSFNASGAESSPSYLPAIRSAMKDSKSSSPRTSKQASKKLATLLMKLNASMADLPLILVVKSENNKVHSSTFMLTSEWERSLWTQLLNDHVGRQQKLQVDAELNKILKSTFNQDLMGVDFSGPVVIGDMVIVVNTLDGLDENQDVFIVIEADYYGAFNHVARTKMIIESMNPVWNERLAFRLEGANELRFLLYTQTADGVDQLRGMFHVPITPEFLETTGQIHEVGRISFKFILGPPSNAFSRYIYRCFYLMVNLVVGKIGTLIGKSLPGVPFDRVHYLGNLLNGEDLMVNGLPLVSCFNDLKYVASGLTGTNKGRGRGQG